MRRVLALLGSLVPTLAVAGPVEPELAEGAISEDRSYGERWSREAGVAVGGMASPALFTATVSPQFGYFIADHVEVSTIVSLTRIQSDASALVVTAIVEPSYHYEIDRRTQLVGGMGFGYAYLSDRRSRHGATYAIRGGVQFLVGRRGVVAPTVSYELRTQDAKLASHDLAYLTSHNALRLNLGYTAIF